LYFQNFMAMKSGGEAHAFEQVAALFVSHDLNVDDHPHRLLRVQRKERQARAIRCGRESLTSRKESGCK